MKTIAACALLGSMTVAGAGAEDLAPGTRVRVVRKGTAGASIGSLVEIGAGGLVVRLKDGGTLRMPLSDLQRLEVSRRGSRRTQGALIGIGLGALGGYALGSSTNDAGGIYSNSQAGAIVAVPGAILGGLVGVVVGDEKWRRVEEGGVQVGLGAQGRGGIALAVRF